VTLLLAFFVTMYSISSVNAGKYRVLSDSLTVAFNGQPHTPQVIDVGSTTANVSDNLPINSVNRMFTAGLPANMHMPLPQANGTVRQGQSSPGSADPRDQANRERAEYELALARQLQQVQDDVSGALSSLVQDGKVKIERHGDNVEVQISTDLLFGSGQATLAAPSLKALQSLAQAMKPWPNHIRVEGHTDDRPISTAVFRSNWELSAARAATVVQIFAANGVAPDRMEVIGHAEYAPLQPNSTNAGRNANRRVSVVILGRLDN
jgi:chemotaxis protein MotB